MSFLVGWPIFRGYVKLREGSPTYQFWLCLSCYFFLWWAALIKPWSLWVATPVVIGTPCSSIDYHRRFVGRCQNTLRIFKGIPGYHCEILWISNIHPYQSANPLPRMILAETALRRIQNHTKSTSCHTSLKSPPIREWLLVIALSSSALPHRLLQFHCVFFLAALSEKNHLRSYDISKYAKSYCDIYLISRVNC